jgi:hypothetical protein
MNLAWPWTFEETMSIKFKAPEGNEAAGKATG